jgi:hypothetical protein
LGAEDATNSCTVYSLPPNKPLRSSDAVLNGVIASLDNPGTFPDVDFEVEGGLIQAHRVILMTYSDKFKGQFQGYFKEASAGKVTINIENCRYDTFKLFLQFCYGADISASLRENSKDMVFLIQMIFLANERILNSIVVKCAY